jgi:fibronectin-binding autotransporter adhesin
MRATRLAVLFAMASALFGALQAPANATLYYWYGDGTNLGGSGTWDLSNTNWSSSDTGGGVAQWPNDATHDAYFQGTGSTVTVDSSVTNAGNLYFATDGYTLTGSGTLTLGAGAATITVDSGVTSIVGTSLTCTGPFNKDGAGTLYFTARQYMGSSTKVINVNQGTLKLTGSPFKYSASKVYIYDTATLDLNGGSFANQMGWYLRGGTLTSSTPFSSSSMGIVADSGSSTVQAGPSAQYFTSGTGLSSTSGSGTLTTSGNGFAAGLTSGRINFSTSTQTGPLIVKDGVTSYYSTAAGAISLTTGNLTLNNGVLAVQAGSTSGAYLTPSFTRSLGAGAGQVQWVGDGGFGALSTSSPTLTVNLGGNATPDALAWGQQYFVQDGSKLVFGGADLNNSTSVTSTVIWQNPIDLANGGDATRTIDVESLKTDSHAAVARIDGVLSDSGGVGSLTKTGAGVLILNAANTYTGTTTVNAGLLNVTGALANNDAAHIFLASSGTSFGSSDPTIARAVPTGAPLASVLAGSTIVGDLETAATVLDGVITADRSVSMAWRNRTAAEQTAAGGGLVSDVLNLQGTGGDIFVLQMSYDADEFAGIWGGPESDLFLAYLDPSSNAWVNAVLGNTGGTANRQNGAYSPSYGLGTYGVDMVNNVAWAVVNHNSQFAVGAALPEPDAFALLAAGLLTLAAYGRRRR